MRMLVQVVNEEKEEKIADENLKIEKGGSKISFEIERVIAKHVPLKFVKANSNEAVELEESINRSKKKGGWLSIKELMKKHHIH